MMTAPRIPASLIDRLPTVRGRYTENVSLAPITWFRVGGSAEVMFRPADEADLSAFIATKPADVAVTVIGVGSNLLVRDGGVPGVVVRLGRHFAEITVDGDTVTAGAGSLDANVALTARNAGIGGLEFLSGVPGTIGGALRMNAGAYGTEMKDVVEEARVISGDGIVSVVAPDQLGFTYRHCALPEDALFLSARLKGCTSDPITVGRRMEEIRTQRENTQPVRTRTGGSTFANPPGAKAWELIERAGCRGLRRGGAMVSEQHCNFLINTGEATAADLEGLGEAVRRRVFEDSGISLRWEIRRIGVPLPGTDGPGGGS